MIVNLNPTQASALRTVSLDAYKAVVSCFYLGMSYSETAELMANPSRSQELASAVSTAVALGLDLKFDAVTVNGKTLYEFSL